MLMDNALKESGLLEKIDYVGCRTDAGREMTVSHLKNSGVCSPILVARSRFIDKLRRGLSTEKREELDSLFEKVAAAEKILSEKERTETAEELAQAATAQIYFDGTLTKPLNAIPYVVMVLSALKIYVAPLMALCLPLIMFIMPYLFITSMMNVQIPWETYKNILLRFIIGIDPAEPWNLKQIVKLFWGVASFGQGIVQPTITAFHTHKIRETFLDYANAIKSYSAYVERIGELFREITGKVVPYLPTVPADPYVSVDWWKKEAVVVQHYRYCLGWYDMYYGLAADKWTPVTWIPGSDTSITDFYDLEIVESKAVRSSIILDGHALVTGPNRGGKSSALRGILQAILCAQAFGVTYGGSRVSMGAPYTRIYTRLVSKDAPGCRSLFESDVAFSMDILRNGGRGKTLVMIDELFHSTNPRDAELSADYFLQNLWKHDSATSLISTHMFDLLKRAPDHVKRVCSKAHVEIGANQIPIMHYTYKLMAGVCDESSVCEVWNEYASI